MSRLEQTLLDIVSLLDEAGIDYAVMGGLAVRVHSIPRATHDVDLTISVDRAKLLGFLQSLELIGYTIPEPYLKGWVDEVAGMPLVKVKTYITPTKGVDVDIFLCETEFQESCLSRRV